MDLSETLVEAQAFQMVLYGRTRLPVERLARQLHTRVARIKPMVAAIEGGGHLLRDGDGCIVAVAGLSLAPTRHQFVVEGTPRWTWCAWDALGIVELLGRGGTVRSRSPDTGVEIVVRFDRDGPAPEPEDAVLVFAQRPDTCVTVRDWCPNVNLFENEATARAWMDRNGVAGELQEVDKAARESAEIYRPLLDEVRVEPWWRRVATLGRRRPQARKDEHGSAVGV